MLAQSLVYLLLGIAMCVGGIQFSWYWLRRLRARMGSHTLVDSEDHLPLIELATRVGFGVSLTILAGLLCTFGALTMIEPTWTLPDWLAIVGLASIGLMFLLCLTAVVLAAVRHMRSRGAYPP